MKETIDIYISDAAEAAGMTIEEYKKSIGITDE